MIKAFVNAEDWPRALSLVDSMHAGGAGSGRMVGCYSQVLV